jgi:hypothetical protein
MRIVRHEDHAKIRAARVQEQGKEPEIRLWLGERTHLALTIGEASALREALKTEIERGGPVQHIMQCEKCPKPATTVVGGKGYCEDHVKEAPR